MVVNASIQFWEDLPPDSAAQGQTIVVTGRILNTGTEEQDFRMSVQIVGVGAAIFPVPLEVWSAPTELAPNELYTCYTTFPMPNYGVQLTIQSEWYNRAGTPAQWVKVGNTATRNVALAGVSPMFPVEPQPAQPVQVGPLQLQIPTNTILLLIGISALAYFLMRK